MSNLPNLVEGLSRSALYQKEQALWSPLGCKSFLSFQFNDWFTLADDSFVCLELAGDWTPLLELVLKAFVRALVQAGERMPRERVWSFSRILSKTFFHSRRIVSPNYWQHVVCWSGGADTEWLPWWQWRSVRMPKLRWPMGTAGSSELGLPKMLCGRALHCVCSCGEIQELDRSAHWR